LPRELGQATEIWPLLRLWNDPPAQHRLLHHDLPYDLLRQADRLLPQDAVVLLVTPGHDVRHLDYTTYHRVLYHLAPRSVWWLSPAPPDGTWESRWWHPAPATADSLCAYAREKSATAVVFFDLPVPTPEVSSRCAAGNLVPLPGGTLLALETSAILPSADAVKALPAPWWPLRLVLALATIVLIGAGLLVALRRVGFIPSALEVPALAWALGVGFLSLALALGASFRTTWSTLMVFLTLLAVAPVPWLLPHVRGAWRWVTMPRLGLSLVELFLLIALLLQWCIVTIHAVGRPLAVWDSWVIWGMKARIIFQAGGLHPAIYADPSRAVTHLDYPLLFPLAGAWIYGWLGVADDRLFGVISSGFYLALISACYAALRRWGVRRAATLAAILAATTGNHLATLAGNAYADLPLAFYAALAAIYLVDALRDRRGVAVVAVLAATFLPWTKREGLVLLLALAVATWWIGTRLSRGRQGAGLAAGMTLGALVVALPWSLFLAIQGITNTDFGPVTLPILLDNLDRLPTIARMTLSGLLDFRWNLLWPLVLVVALASPRHTPHPSNLLPLAAVIYLIVMSLTYVFSAFVPYQAHIASSAYRLAGHVTALLALWLATRSRSPEPAPPVTPYPGSG
jgi:hypothetical protein